MQVFGKRYYEQMSSMGLLSADAAYVLAFSVIMLNTDLHNTQVRAVVDVCCCPRCRCRCRRHCFSAFSQPCPRQAAIPCRLSAAPRSQAHIWRMLRGHRDKALHAACMLNKRGQQPHRVAATVPPFLLLLLSPCLPTCHPAPPALPLILPLPTCPGCPLTRSQLYPHARV